MRPEVVVIGTSLGGLSALEELLGGLHVTFPVPVVVVQHRGVHSGSAMRATLQRHTALRVREPDDKEPLLAGKVYIAPPDYHLLVERGAIALSIDAPVMYARPSINVLFESAADAYGSNVLAVVLTGASSDGAKGAAWVKQHGGRVMVQDPATAECGVMPRATMQATVPDWVLPLEAMAPILERICAPDAVQVGIPGLDGLVIADGKRGKHAPDGQYASDGKPTPGGDGGSSSSAPQPAEGSRRNKSASAE